MVEDAAGELGAVEDGELEQEARPVEDQAVRGLPYRRPIPSWSGSQLRSVRYRSGVPSAVTMRKS